MELQCVMINVYIAGAIKEKNFNLHIQWQVARLYQESPVPTQT